MGVARFVNLVNVKVFCGGQGVADIIAGIDWVIADHAPGTAAVANLSLITLPDTNLDEAVQRLEGDGIFVAIGAGNGQQTPPNTEPDDACLSSPARMGRNLPNTLTVSATMRVGNSDTRAVGTDWSANTGPCVELFAPGMDVDAAAAGGGLILFDGTSAAAPYVAGQAARMFSGGWNLYAESWIRQNATPNVVGDAGAGSPNLLLYTRFQPRCRL